MALQFLKGLITKEGKLMIIFSGGGKQIWYPSEKEIEKIYQCSLGIERIKEKVNELESNLNQEQ